jgi:hypothetical protein
MDYYIMGILSTKVEFNADKNGLFRLGELGDDIGLQMQTSIHSYKRNVLSIGSKFELFVEYNGQSHWIARCNSVSMFEFLNPSLLTRGQTTNAMHLLKECSDLSEAHAYGHFCYIMERNELPSVPTRVQPYEEAEPAFRAFLDSVNEIRKPTVKPKKKK